MSVHSIIGKAGRYSSIISSIGIFIIWQIYAAETIKTIEKDISESSDTTVVSYDGTVTEIETTSLQESVTDSTLTDSTLTDSTLTDSTLADSTLADSTTTDTAQHILRHPLSDSIHTVRQSGIQLNDSTETDTLRLVNGVTFGGALGWSLGGFALTEYWEKTLPDSLGSFGLEPYSYSTLFDDSALIDIIDTAALIFSIKDKPTIYTLSFPLSVSLLSITDQHRLSATLRGAWMRKNITAGITFKNDSTDQSIDYRQSINIYTLFLSFTYGKLIPPEYFTTESIERCFILCGIDFSPIVYTRIATHVTIPSDNKRIRAIKNKCYASHRSLYGGAAALRLGLSMMKRINKTSATEFTICYSMQGYGFFFENEERVSIKDIYPSYSKKDRPLSWISNRFEIGIMLFRQKDQQQTPVQ